MHVHPLSIIKAAVVHGEALFFHLHGEVCVDVPRKKSPSLGTLKAIVLVTCFFGLFLHAEKNRVARKLSK